MVSLSYGTALASRYDEYKLTCSRYIILMSLIILAHDEELWKGLVESIYKRKPKRSRQDRRSELISTL